MSKTKAKRAMKSIKDTSLPPGKYVLQVGRPTDSERGAALVGRIVGGPYDGRKVVFSS